MKFKTAFALTAKYAPAAAGKLWDTTACLGCDTANAIAHQYSDAEQGAAKAALQQIAEGRVPEGWEEYVKP